MVSLILYSITDRNLSFVELSLCVCRTLYLFIAKHYYKKYFKLSVLLYLILDRKLILLRLRLCIYFIPHLLASHLVAWLIINYVRTDR